MRRALTLLAVAVVTALAGASSATAAAGGVTGGVITVGRGADGIVLGMSRAQVVARLGRPLYENGNGYMQYAPPSSRAMFDVYRDSGARASRVRMLGFAGSGFKLSDGNHIFATGGLRRLAARYGAQLRFHSGIDPGPYYELVTRVRVRRVLTDFSVDRHSLSARVLGIFILFQ